MSEKLRLSVIIPTYNRAPLVSRAVKSALAVVDRDDEIIVVDDGSTDGTEQALTPFMNRIRYLKLRNGGAGRARNIGVSESTGDLVAFLDSDDEWMSDKLELQRTLMSRRPDLLYSFSDFTVIEDGDRVIHRYLINWHNDTRAWSEILGPGVSYSTVAELPASRPDFTVYVGNLFAAQMAALYVFTSTLIVRRRDAGAALRFAEDMGIYEDWECYGRVARAGLGAFLDTETTWNHGHRGDRLTDARALDRVEARIKVLERVWGSDAGYRASHGEHYDQVMREQRILRTKELLWAGKPAEARRELSRVSAPPLSCRMLAVIPGGVTQSLLRFRRSLRSA